MFAALPEAWNLVPTLTLGGSKLLLTPAPGDLVLSPSFSGSPDTRVPCPPPTNGQINKQTINTSTALSVA